MVFFVKNWKKTRAVFQNTFEKLHEKLLEKSKKSSTEIKQLHTLGTELYIKLSVV